ncbi:alcohol dehydrogenase [Stereum hirsutum FP-91666 SS1]|uniref:alcohol dehydrogenase n=1 Tax=Stereum hirsutum (strain FP-91666) TaxID=721885 RepID=UPI000440DA4F|nr:alcohol dehydrogenase [Stereum hirsutum FP-91666 SS1]EIM91203.1 alcohol dehydrogenase [Stereum hirsutum FP-91666 SS1]
MSTPTATTTTPIQLPQTHSTLVVTSTSSPLTVEQRALPTVTPGSALVRIICSGVVSYIGEVFSGKRKYPFPTPFVPGTSAIGRVTTVGPDATSLKPGQLVYVDCFIRGRDDPDARIMMGMYEGYSEETRKLMRGEWRDGTFAEYAKVPLENCFVLDEARLTGGVGEGGLGYEVEKLVYLSTLLVPYGGLRDVGLQAGETVVVAPATGAFGGAAVQVALAMGAKVIAMGRNKQKLRKIKAVSERVEVVPITGDMEKDTEALKQFGPVDVFFDISPPEAATSTHLNSGIHALRHGGRASLMGGLGRETALPFFWIVFQDLQLKGKWMYERKDIESLIKMVRAGVMKLDMVDIVGKFRLAEWEKAFEVAKENADMGQMVLITP